MVAFHENQQEIIKFLLGIKSLDFEVKDSNNWNTLHYAVQNRSTTGQIIYKIAQNMPDELINDINDDGDSALEFAVRTGHTEAVSALAQMPGLIWEYSKLQDICKKMNGLGDRDKQ